MKTFTANGIRFAFDRMEGFIPVYASTTWPTLELRHYTECCGVPEHWELSWDQAAKGNRSHWVCGSSCRTAESAVKCAAWHERDSRMFGPRPRREPADHKRWMAE